MGYFFHVKVTRLWPIKLYIRFFFVFYEMTIITGAFTKEVFVTFFVLFPHVDAVVFRLCRKVVTYLFLFEASYQKRGGTVYVLSNNHPLVNWRVFVFKGYPGHSNITILSYLLRISLRRLVCRGYLRPNPLRE